VKNNILNILNKYGVGFSFIGLMLLQRGYFGFKYYPVIDDWFLYGGNALYKDKWNEFIVPNKILALRPFAGLVDSYVIGPFHNHLWVVNIMLIAMLMLATYWFYIVLKQNSIAVGSIFICVLAFLPLGLEATHWMSASARIVFALFFISLNAYFLNLYIKHQKAFFLVIHIIAGVFCVGFYELAIPVYILFVFMLLYQNRQSFTKKWIGLLPIVNLIAIAIYYKLNASHPDIAQRGNLISGDWVRHTVDVFSQIFYVLVIVNLKVIKNGFLYAMDLFIQNNDYIYLFLCVVFSVAVGYFSGKKLKRTFDYKLSFIVGILLFGAGIAVNLVIAYIRLPIRVVFFSFIGLGIIAEAIVYWISDRFSKKIYSVVVTVLIFVFTVTGVGEIAQYNKTSQIDASIAKALIDSEDGTKVCSQQYSTYLFGAKQSYFNTSVQYYEHIKTAIESYGALTGCVKQLTQNPYIENIMPVEDGHEVELPYVHITRKYLFFVLEQDYSVTKATLLEKDNKMVIVREDGSIFGFLQEDAKDWFAFTKQ
jgi:hypothetical protein